MLWIAVAALAPAMARGRVRYEAAVAVVLLVLALGGIVVLYWIPGVGMFRLPARKLTYAELRRQLEEWERPGG